MDMSTYEWQVKALRRYATIPQIPRDPYDVPVAFARRLLHYDKSIHLSASQQATYDRAMGMSREKGPCCCHCWRWTAFQGHEQVPHRPRELERSPSRAADR